MKILPQTLAFVFLIVFIISCSEDVDSLSSIDDAEFSSCSSVESSSSITKSSDDKKSSSSKKETNKNKSSSSKKESDKSKSSSSKNESGKGKSGSSVEEFEENESSSSSKIDSTDVESTESSESSSDSQPDTSASGDESVSSGEDVESSESEPVNPSEEDSSASGGSSDAKTANVNANDKDDPAAIRMEMPHLDRASFFAAHWVDVDNRHIMNLAIEWNSSIRHANWTSFSWDSLTSQTGTDRSNTWGWDPIVPKDLGEVKEVDHKNDGFDKGHLIASADRRYSKDANEQTFYYTNISPQFSSFNQNFWARLEAKLQEWGALTQNGTFDTIYVAKGGDTHLPLIDFTGSRAGSDKKIPTTDSKGFSVGGMLVPSYYFAALLALKDGKYNAIAFYVPHSEDLVKSPSKNDFLKYVVTVDYLEATTGIDFFCNLPDDIETDVESKVDIETWPW